MRIAYRTGSDAATGGEAGWHQEAIFASATETSGARWRPTERIVQYEIPADANLSPGAGSGTLVLERVSEIVTIPAVAPYRYLLGCSVDPANEAEFHRWYDGEHLPGLAAVDGTFRAARFRSHDPATGRTRWFAQYDIRKPDVVGSPDWLKVRHSSWSGRVIPTMANVERSMLRRVPA